MTMDAAKKFVQRMQKRAYIAAAGPRTAYYYNLVKDSHAQLDRRLEVVQALYPEAIVIGLNVLHHYGWITQRPYTFDVAVDGARRSLCKIDGVELRPRSRDWFAEQHFNNAILTGDESPFGIDSITPRAALDDIRDMQDIWVPDPDDLFIPQDEEEGVMRSPQARLSFRQT